jgi:AcrR family transcriptional regulator
VVSRGVVIRAALELLESEGFDAITMRGIAKRLKVDPMALYHYFDDRHAVVIAAAAFVYESLEVPHATGWRQRLRALAIAYVDMAARFGELMRYLIAHADAVPEPVQIFNTKFDEALGGLRVRAASRDAFVDLLHGFAMAAPRNGLTAAMRARLIDEIDVLIDGIRGAKGS